MLKTKNNTYERMNNSTVRCTSNHTIQSYLFTVPVNSNHVPSTCNCAYRYRGQKCTHLRELKEYLAWEREPVEEEQDRKAAIGATVGVSADDAQFLFA
jgi:hypothetical protein